MHHHHDLSGSGGPLVLGLLIVMTLGATAFHLRVGFSGATKRSRRAAFGHALMGTGMVYMLASGATRAWDAGWAVVFGLSGGLFLVAAVDSTRRHRYRAGAGYGDVVLGDGAMVSMLGVGWPPVTAALAAYFVVRSLLGAIILAQRAVVIGLPPSAVAAADTPTEERPPIVSPWGRAAPGVTAAHLAMGLPMAYMLIFGNG